MKDDWHKSATTESAPELSDLETLDTRTLLEGINAQDQTVPHAVQKAIPQIEPLVEVVVSKMRVGGRLFYMGAGTSGRLGVVDASECPPTFGIPHGKVVGIIAGGDGAIRKAVEGAEDDMRQGWRDLVRHQANFGDVVVGIAASGRTPYVLGALRQCKAVGIVTGCIVCNPGSAIAHEAEFPIVVEVGPEFIAGSTRMKSGTAQKLVLNMISTAVMVRLGHVLGNSMIDMLLTNEKLFERGVRMILERTPLKEDLARKALKEEGSVRAVLEKYSK